MTCTHLKSIKNSLTPLNISGMTMNIKSRSNAFIYSRILNISKQIMILKRKILNSKSNFRNKSTAFLNFYPSIFSTIKKCQIKIWSLYLVCLSCFEWVQKVNGFLKNKNKLNLKSIQLEINWRRFGLKFQVMKNKMTF